MGKSINSNRSTSTYHELGGMRGVTKDCDDGRASRAREWVTVDGRKNGNRDERFHGRVFHFGRISCMKDHGEK